MAKAILTKKLYRVVEMINGVPHSTYASSAASTDLKQENEAIKRLRKLKERNPTKNYMILETEPLTWITVPDPHPTCEWSAWTERRKYTGGRTGEFQDAWSRKCQVCDTEEWVDDVPAELIDPAVTGLQQIASELDGT